MASRPITFQQLLVFPAEKMIKEIPCGKCGQPMQVNACVVMAFCRDCLSVLGVKR